MKTNILSAKQFNGDYSNLRHSYLKSIRPHGWPNQCPGAKIWQPRLFHVPCELFFKTVFIELYSDIFNTQYRSTKLSSLAVHLIWFEAIIVQLSVCFMLNELYGMVFQGKILPSKLFLHTFFVATKFLGHFFCLLHNKCGHPCPLGQKPKISTSGANEFGQFQLRGTFLIVFQKVGRLFV